MKSNFNTNFVKLFSLLTVIAFFAGCENDESDFDTVHASKNPDVFIDGFSATLNYASFGGAVPAAFQVDNDVTYNHSASSMRFDVPNPNNPAGAYVGGSFFTTAPRDLSGYDALTFWAKATQGATIDVIGFGNDFGANKYQASISGMDISTAWQKYIIPIPDAAKLTQEKGMLFLSEGPEDGHGYTFWLDNVKFEKLGTIAHGDGSILAGQDVIKTSFIGVTEPIGGLTAVFNLPNGTNQAVNVTPAYFVFTSSDPAVATVDANGNVSVIGAGSAVITATLGGVAANGSLTINSGGVFAHAPTPTENASDVISLYSETYPNVPVDYYNGYWAPYQTTQSADFTVAGDNVLNYTNFNFVGVQFSAPTVNASSMSHLHIDLFLPNAVAPGSNFKITVRDYGANGVYDGGGDDTTALLTYTAPTLVSQNWISLDIPFTSMPTLAARSHLGQLVFEGTNVTSFYADNIYFYNNGSIIPPVPGVAAPTPSYSAANVTSIFSDAYTNVAGTDFNPNWGQATVVTQVPIATNNTLRYGGLNYQGIVFTGTVNVSSRTFLHLDFYTANSTSLKVYLISAGPVEVPSTLTVPTTAGWNSVDIPLSSFGAVNLSSLIQMKFDGNGDIYLDNILFRN